MKIFSESLIQRLLGSLLFLLILMIVDYYIDTINTENYIIVSKSILKIIALSIIVILMILAFYIIPKIRSKRKNIKYYSPIQIEIAKKILSGKIKNVNDFFIDFFKPELLDKPFNSSDKNKNYFVPKDENERAFLIGKFKELIYDLIKYEYIRLKYDDSIEIFTYLRKSNYRNARDGMEISHDLVTTFKKHFKQKRFIIIDHQKLKKLTKKKSIYIKEQKK